MYIPLVYMYMIIHVCTVYATIDLLFLRPVATPTQPPPAPVSPHKTYNTEWRKYGRQSPCASCLATPTPMTPPSSPPSLRC